jgi:protein TonB
MTQAGFYQPGHRSPTALTIVILLHGAALTALALAKMDMPAKPKIVNTQVHLIKVKPDPKPIPPEPIKQAKPTQVQQVERIVVVPPPPWTGPDLSFTRTTGTSRTVEPVYPEAKPQPDPPPLPKAEPVRRDAQIDPHSELKPPYPASEQRMGNEGTVTVRVRIGTDGRVKSAEKLRATSDAFFQATLRHALRSWRFKPATVDGRPIESSKVMTLHFTLEGDA